MHNKFSPRVTNCHPAEIWSLWPLLPESVIKHCIYHKTHFHSKTPSCHRTIISCIQLLGDDIDQLSRDGFHWIIQKVIFKVGNVRFSPFSHNYWYYSIVTKCCPNLLHHVASVLWNQSCPKIWKVWNHSKGHFQGQKIPIWTFVIYFS